jgi:hypothetical protein
MEADSIAHVTRQVDAGLAGTFDPADCLIINADGASRDQTSRVFLETPTECRKEALVVTEQPGGKGRNVLRVLEYCAEREVGALALVDADLTSITPDWISGLLTPVARGGADYVLPLYWRRRFDGTATNHVAYPLMYGYFGRDWRQPIGGEFAMSSEFANHLLRQRVEDAVYGYGIDIFMTAHAAGSNFRVAQVGLGRKLHKPGFPKWARITPQVLASAFAVARQYPFRTCVEERESVLRSIDDSQENPNFDRGRELLAEMRLQALGLKPVYRSWLGEEAGEIEGVFDSADPMLSAGVWAALLTACFARALWAEPEASAASLAEQLVPAFNVRAITFWKENQRRAPDEIEAEIRNQARMFSENLARRHREFGRGL